MTSTWLTDDPIDTSKLVDLVMRRSDGALVLFSGVVRDHSDGKAVESIYYDAYRSMADKEIARVVLTIEAEFPDVAMAVLHRLGHLEVGEVSIAIACASPHRAEAFAACRNTIDRIKHSVPIWKRERSPDGEEWVGWQGQC